MNRDKSPLGPVQDFYIGFLAPLGLVPIAALLYSAFAIVVGVVGLLMVALMFGLVRPTRRS